jgi:hypothetical protein
MRSSLVVAAVVALSTLPAAEAGAQGANRPSPESYRQSFTLNPFGIPWGFINAEFERVIGAGATVGLAGSYIEWDGEDDRVSSAEAKFRYYPAENGLRGFSIGLAGGYTRVEDNGSVFGGDRDVLEGPSLGVTVDYNWLLGKRRRFVVGLGLGAKRIFGEDRPDRDGLDDLIDRRAYPTGRFVVGLAF